jgi:hypothetical protein
MLEHILYSPDLAPCDFFLLKKLKSLSKGTHLQSVEDIPKKTVESPKVLFTLSLQGMLQGLEGSRGALYSFR